MAAASRAAVNVILSMLGIGAADQTILRSLARDGEFMVADILDTAKSLMIVDRRDRMTVRDINEALTVSGMEEMYGYAGKRNIDMKVVRFNKNIDLVVERDEPLAVDFFTDIDKYQYPLQSRFECTWVCIDGHACVSSEEIKKEPESEPVETAIESSKLRMYFETTLESFSFGGIDYEITLARMSKSAGIGSLLPSYLDFIRGRLVTEQDNVEVMRKTVGLLRAIVANDAYNVLMYIEDIVGITMTALLSRDTMTNEDVLLREEAGELLGFICQRNSTLVPTLTASVGNELVKALFDDGIDEVAIYGSLTALRFLGCQVIRNCLFPVLDKFVERVLSLPAPDRALIGDGLFALVGGCLQRDQARMWEHGHYPYDNATAAQYWSIVSLLGMEMVQFEYGPDSLLFM